MRLKLLALASILATGSSSLFAAAIPYPNPGTTLPATPELVTANSNTITAYFVSVSASDTDTLFLFDETTHTLLGPAFGNQGSVQGDLFNFAVTAGDTYALEIQNSSDHPTQTFSSDPALSSDGGQHAYLTPFAGGTLANGDGTAGSFLFPAGTYVGFEDLDFPLSGGEPDYNDLTFVFTNVTPVINQTGLAPEPSTFILLGTGLLGAAGAVRRKLSR
jgi:PEP-CTERM motif